MTLVLIVLAVFVGLLGGMAAGLRLGEKVRGRPRRYWALNGVAVVVCMVADFAGLMLGWPWLAYGSLGAMGGAITGLKYGYAESIGVWRSIDRVTGVAPLEAPEDAAERDDPAAE